MNKKFKVIDENNIQREANLITIFEENNKLYSIYSIDRDNMNANIFVSELIKDEVGQDILKDVLEKEKIQNIVKDIIKKPFDESIIVLNSIKEISNRLENDILYNINVTNSYVATASKEVINKNIEFYKDKEENKKTDNNIELSINEKENPVVHEMQSNDEIETVNQNTEIQTVEEIKNDTEVSTTIENESNEITSLPKNIEIKENIQKTNEETEDTLDVINQNAEISAVEEIKNDTEVSTTIENESNEITSLPKNIEIKENIQKTNEETEDTLDVINQNAEISAVEEIKNDTEVSTTIENESNEITFLPKNVDFGGNIQKINEERDEVLTDTKPNVVNLANYVRIVSENNQNNAISADKVNEEIQTEHHSKVRQLKREKNAGFATNMFLSVGSVLMLIAGIVFLCVKIIESVR